MQSPGGFYYRWFIKAYLWATELLYGPFAWAYDAVAWLVSFGYWSQWRLDALPYLKPGSVLEVGFGTGELLIALAEAGYDVVGLELSPQMHRVAGRKLTKRRLSLKRVRGDTRAMPLPSGVFDNLIATFPSNYILEHRTLVEIHRVLDHHGRCVVLGLGVQFKSAVKARLSRLWLGSRADQMIHIFIQSVEIAGFSVKRVDHQGSAYLLPVLILEPNDAE